MLVRGVNVGGHNRLPMREFATLLEALGGQDVVTYLQSGNAVLTRDPAGLAEQVEGALTDRLGLSVRVFVRTATDLARVVADNPFPDAVETPKLLHVAFLDGDPDPALVAAVGLEHGEDALAVGDRALYLRYGASARDNALGPPLRRLGGVCTARNWTTLLALTRLSAS